MRRAALLAALALPLAGCVTYEVVDRDTYYRRSDGAIVYRGEVYYPEPSHAIDPYDAWFYGWRGPVVVLDRWRDPWYDPWFDPWFGSRVSVSRWSSGWYWSYGLGWWNPWPYGYGWHGGGWYGGGWNPPPSGGPRPRPPQVAIERPMPKPSVRAVGPEVVLPPRDGPSVRGEAAWPQAGGRRQAEPTSEAPMRWEQARPMPRRPVVVEAGPSAGRPLVPERPAPFERPAMVERPVDHGRRLHAERPVVSEPPAPFDRPMMRERPEPMVRPMPAPAPAPRWDPPAREERTQEPEERIE